MPPSADDPASDALFELPDPGPAPLPPHPVGWPEKPVAKILLDSGVPHLDRPFDYLIPPELDEPAQPGVRVKVRFGHQEQTGWLLERTDAAATHAKLSEIRQVVSAMPVLTPTVVALAQDVARYYAGTVADVLRAAVPPRMARVEREVAAAVRDGDIAEPALLPSTTLLEETHSGPDQPQGAGENTGSTAFRWEDLAGGTEFWSENPPHRRAALTLPASYGRWDAMRILADAAARTAAQGRSAIIIVPDIRELDRLCRVVEDQLGATSYARLDGKQGNTSRYRHFLSVLTGQRRIVLGTRSAIWAPVDSLGLIAVWNDDDHLLTEPRAPYFHVRDVALLRLNHSPHARLLLASTSRSLQTQRLIDQGPGTADNPNTDYVHDLDVPRDLKRAVAARVISTADSYHQARDPLAHRARLPGTAWRIAREALHGSDRIGPAGPVLVQVHRAGFIPGLFCDRCSTPARCQNCGGPLSYTNQWAAARNDATCRWCGQHTRNFRCITCGGQKLRAGARGADRTAEELGRAFPQVPVLSSTAEHMLATVPTGPDGENTQAALVIATPGAEPVAPSGYAAALLLDGDAQLQRDGLTVPERVLAHWMRAASLVRPATAGGRVVVTARSRQDVVSALTLGNPAGFASRALAERMHLGFPPARRVAELSGPKDAVHVFIRDLPLPYHADDSPWVGPTPREDNPDEHRALLFFPHHVSEDVTAALRARRAVMSAERSTPPVRVTLDGIDVL